MLNERLIILAGYKNPPTAASHYMSCISKHDSRIGDRELTFYTKVIDQKNAVAECQIEGLFHADSLIVVDSGAHDWSLFSGRNYWGDAIVDYPDAWFAGAFHRANGSSHWGRTLDIRFQKNYDAGWDTIDSLDKRNRVLNADLFRVWARAL